MKGSKELNELKECEEPKRGEKWSESAKLHRIEELLADWRSAPREGYEFIDEKVPVDDEGWCCTSLPSRSLKPRWQVPVC